MRLLKRIRGDLNNPPLSRIPDVAFATARLGCVHDGSASRGFRCSPGDALRVSREELSE